jgi:hypothetical protein
MFPQESISAKNAKAAKNRRKGIQPRMDTDQKMENQSLSSSA